MTLNLIVAMTEERVIGYNNQLPWHLSEDLKRFKKITMGHPIIMGRKTYESIGKPLPGRTNIVVSKQYRQPSMARHPQDTRHPRESGDPGLKPVFVGNLGEAIEIGKKSFGGEELFVIGGAKIFELALPLVNRIYLTRIHQKFEGDVFFPEIDLQKDFVVKEEERGVSEKGIPFSFIRIERNVLTH